MSACSLISILVISLNCSMASRQLPDNLYIKPRRYLASNKSGCLLLLPCNSLRESVFPMPYIYSKRSHRIVEIFNIKTVFFYYLSLPYPFSKNNAIIIPINQRPTFLKERERVKLSMVEKQQQINCIYLLFLPFLIKI